MNKPSKCKNCQWYGKPYWSIINPCDNCPNENSNVTIIKIDGEPIFKEYATDEDIKRAIYEKMDFIVKLEQKQQQIDQLTNNWNELEEYIENEWKVVAESPDGSFYDGYDTCMEEMKKDILDKMKEIKEGK